MHYLLSDFRRLQPSTAISWLRHFGMGLGLGLVTLILLQILFQPFHFSRPQATVHTRPTLSADVSALGESLEHNGLSDTRQIAAFLERMRKNSGGQIAWIRLRNSSGQVVVQTGHATPMQSASNELVRVKSWEITLPAGDTARLDVAIRIQQSGARKQSSISNLRQI